jgi:hypothetical protein
MTILWTILGMVAGGGLGWLYGSWRKRRQQDDCETPT